MELFNYLRKELCEPNLKSRKKEAVIDELAALIKRHPAIDGISQEEIAAAISARENLGSTGFGGGLAIPHCKLPGISEFIVGLAVSKRGVNFDAMDGKKVHLFCFIVGPEGSPETHVKILAEISLVLREESVRRELLNAKTPTTLYEEFLRHSTPEKISDETKEQKLLMMVVQNEDNLVDIMELFVEMGIVGASMVPSEGMAGILTKVPLFADFINFLGQRSEFHKTVWAVVPANDVEPLVERIEAITGDMDKHIGTMVLALDIAYMKGSMETI